jgi:hypothetical protein
MTPSEASIRIKDVTQYGLAQPSVLRDSNRIFKITTSLHPVTVFSHQANEHPEINNTLEWRKRSQEGRKYICNKAVIITGVSVNRRSGRLVWTRQWIFGFHKIQVNYGYVEELLAAEGGLIHEFGWCYCDWLGLMIWNRPHEHSRTSHHFRCLSRVGCHHTCTLTDLQDLRWSDNINPQ